MIGQHFFSDIYALIFLAQYYQHDIGYFELSVAGLSVSFEDVEIVDVEIVDEVARVGLEEYLFVVEAEG